MIPIPTHFPVSAAIRVAFFRLPVFLQ